MAACADEADKPVLGADMKELAKDIWNRPWSEERRNDWERWLALAANCDVPMMKNAAKTIGNVVAH